MLIADAHSLCRQELRQAIEVETDLLVVEEAQSASQAAKLSQTARPDILLIDIELLLQDGIRANAVFTQINPPIQVIVLMTCADTEHACEALCAGAKAHLLKDTPASQLIQTIRAVFEGQVRMDSQVTALVLKEFRRLKQFQGNP